MAVSAFCMDRCPHPNPSCYCSCHGETDDDDGFLERARAVIERREEREERSGFVVFDRHATGPCPVDGCTKQVSATGPGRASHLRWHAKRGLEDEPARESPPAVTTSEVEPAPDPPIWNVVAPAGSDTAIAEAAGHVLSTSPDLSGAALSKAIAALVPGARPGPEIVVSVDVEIEPATEQTPVVYETDDEPEPDVSLTFSDADRALLTLLADASPVWNDIGDVVLGLLRSKMDEARGELAWGLCEMLRYSGGMTADEVAAYDAASS